MYPIILVLGCLGALQWHDLKPRCIRLLKMFIIMSLPVVVYLALRMYLFPFKGVGSTVIFQVPSFQISRMCHFFYDLFWLHWFPWNTYQWFVHYADGYYYSLYVALKILIMSLCTLLFITNTRKLLVLTAALAATTFYWQFCIGVGLSIKQLYESLPCSLFAIAVLVGYARAMSWLIMRHMVLITIVASCLLNATMVIWYVDWIRNYCGHKFNAVQIFKKNVQDQLLNSSTVLVGNTSPLSSVGIIQSLDLQGISHQVPRYFFTAYCIAPWVTYDDIKHDLTVAVHDCTVRITSPEKRVPFLRYESLPGYVSSVTVHDRVDDCIYDWSLTFHPVAPQVIIAYCYHEGRFIVLHTSQGVS